MAAYSFGFEVGMQQYMGRHSLWLLGQLHMAVPLVSKQYLLYSACTCQTALKPNIPAEAGHRLAEFQLLIRRPACEAR